MAGREMGGDKSWVLGRKAQIKIGHPEVSARHVRITYSTGRWTIADLKSTNGTYVNSRLTKSAELAEGDLVDLGVDGPRYRFSRRASTGAAAGRRSERGRDGGERRARAERGDGHDRRRPSEEEYSKAIELLDSLNSEPRNSEGRDALDTVAVAAAAGSEEATTALIRYTFVFRIAEAAARDLLMDRSDVDDAEPYAEIV